jgi:hypothetical protein
MRSKKIGASNPRTLTAVLVRRTDTTTRCSDLTCAPSELSRLINEDMVVKNEVSVPVNNKAAWIDLRPCGTNTIDF